jgi:hypothetical protein
MFSMSQNLLSVCVHVLEQARMLCLSVCHLFTLAKTAAHKKNKTIEKHSCAKLHVIDPISLAHTGMHTIFKECYSNKTGKKSSGDVFIEQ